MRDDVKILPYTLDQTNFPKVGLNCKVSLAYSKFDVFNVDFALHLRRAYPSIWDLGQANPDMFDSLITNWRRGKNKAPTPVEEAAVRYREAWAIRNYRLPVTLINVMSQIRWLVVGHKGIDAMREVLRVEGGVMGAGSDVLPATDY